GGRKTVGVRIPSSAPFDSPSAAFGEPQARSWRATARESKGTKIAFQLRTDDGIVVRCRSCTSSVALTVLSTSGKLTTYDCDSKSTNRASARVSPPHDVR